jgi:hypothetical protein
MSFPRQHLGLLIGIFAGFALGILLPRTRVVAVSAHVQAPAPAQQTGRQPQFENDNVRVWKSLILPNSPLTLHRHDHGRVIIALRGGTMNIVDSTGPKDVHVWESGHAYWLPAMPPGAMHSDVNAGNSPIEVMVVELKNDK